PRTPFILPTRQPDFAAGFDHFLWAPTDRTRRKLLDPSVFMQQCTILTLPCIVRPSWKKVNTVIRGQVRKSIHTMTSPLLPTACIHLLHFIMILPCLKRV